MKPTKNPTAGDGRSDLQTSGLHLYNVYDDGIFEVENTRDKIKRSIRRQWYCFRV